MMKFLSFVGKLFVGVFDLCKRMVFISFLFAISVFILAVFMPENVQAAVNIFKNLLQIP